MKPEINTATAETVQTGGDQAVVQERFVRLLARFRGFVSARRETAERWRDKGEPRVASSSDRAADFFERCADELERVINGEMPADPGCDWPPANALTAAANHEWAHDYFETNAEHIRPDSTPNDHE
jgi:hypothetical protein